jgi:hypothetical protein
MIEEKDSSTHSQPETYRMLKTDILLFISPFLILVGWFLSVSGSVSGYESTLSLYRTVGYPYSPIGLAVMMSATTTLSLGIAYRWMNSVSRGAFIVLEVLGGALPDTCGLCFGKRVLDDLGSANCLFMVQFCQH